LRTEIKSNLNVLLQLASCSALNNNLIRKVYLIYRFNFCPVFEWKSPCNCEELEARSVIASADGNVIGKRAFWFSSRKDTERNYEKGRKSFAHDRNLESQLEQRSLMEFPLQILILRRLCRTETAINLQKEAVPLPLT